MRSATSGFLYNTISEEYDESASQESIYFSQQAEIEVGLVQAQKKDTGASPASGCFALKQWAGAWMYNGIDHNVVPKNSCDAVNSADQVICAAGSDYARVMTDYAPDHSWIAISRSEDGEGETGVVEFYEPSMDVAGSGRKSVVLDKGNIHYFRESLIDADDGSKARVVFYTNNAGSDEDGNRHLLNSLYLAPVDRKDGDGNFELSVDSTSYDIEMPTNSFKLETIAGALNLYWVSTATVKQDGKELDAYRVNYAVYDQGTNTLSNASVCAEFTLPEQDLVIRDLFLTPRGKGYFTAAEIPDDDDPDEEVTVSLYHFETNLMPVLDLKGQVIEDTLVCVGDFDDFSISVMNSGNMAATSFDLQVVMIVEDETTHQKTESVEGMLHADLLNPENSYMRIGDKDISTGEKAFYRLEDYDLTPQRCDWVVGEASKKYTVEGGSLTSTEDVNSQAQYVKTKVLLPGALAALKSTIQIPSTWKGDIGLELRLVKKSNYVNWVGAMATAAGKVSNSAISKNAPVPNAANTELTWELDPETGDMVLQNNLLQGPYNGLVSSVIKAPESVKTETLHDLSVDDRVYWGPDGEKWLSITVVDLAQTGESIKLTGEMYLDDDDKPIPFGVDRYYPDAVSDGVAHTFVMPLAALVDPSAYKTARVVIKGVGIEECALANNEFTLYLDGESDPLTFLKQPRDMTVQPGETVTFAVKVIGGVSPYSYQWQMWDAKHKKWKDIPGFTDASMTRENIEKKWDGCRFRCVVKDREGMSAISDEAKLTVREKVPTGDNSNLPLYLAVAAVALALLALLRRRARRA